MADETVMMSHGSGGTMMQRIIHEVFLESYGDDILAQGDDAASLSGFDSGRIALSTDTFVVTPRFFPGGDIGRLAICGTVNDVATSGAQVKYLSAGFVLEEGLPMDELRRICASMAATCAEAGVQIVTGDTKVVNRGHGDGIYINTTGVGLCPKAGTSRAGTSNRATRSSSRDRWATTASRSSRSARGWASRPASRATPRRSTTSSRACLRRRPTCVASAIPPAAALPQR